MEWKSRDARLRTVALAGLVGLTAAAAAAAACRVRQARRARKRQRAAGKAASLGAEIREALEREAAELQRDMPAEELQTSFAAAAAFVSAEGGKKLSTKVKLTLYGCYKQVSMGDASEAAPRSGGMEGAYKWEAWLQLRGTSRAEAMQNYVRTLDETLPDWRSADIDEEEEEEEELDWYSSADAKAGKGGGQGSQAADGSNGFGNKVSTMPVIGDSDDVDNTPVGQLCAKIADGEVEAAFALLRRSPELALQADKDHMTPLHWAADRGELEVAKVLIQEVLKSSSNLLDAQDEDGDTPLHFAVIPEHVELAQLLVVAGADRSAKNKKGETPVDLAGGELLKKVFGGAS